MRGLIEKDLRLTVIRKQTLLVFLVMSLVMGFSVNGTFIITYLTMFAMIVSTGTLSYDEFDNGYTFLMTLPFDRKTYVREKYLFSLITGVVAWCFGAVVYSVSKVALHGGTFSTKELIMAAVIIPVMYMATGLMIPLQLKFGAEKSIVALFVICGVCAAVAFGVKAIAGDMANPVEGLVNMVAGLPGYVCGLAIVLLSVVVSFISYMFSVRIMEKKEF